MVIKVGDTVKVSDKHGNVEYVGTITKKQSGDDYTSSYGGQLLYWAFWNNQISETFLTSDYLSTANVVIISNNARSKPSWF